MYQEPGCRRQYYHCTACVRCNCISQLCTSQRVSLKLRELFTAFTTSSALCSAPNAVSNAFLLVPRAERSCYRSEVMSSISILHRILLLAAIHTKQEALLL